MGQIDVVDQYESVAQIDGYYVLREALDQSATFSLAGEKFTARAIKVYPEITAGTFEVDLVFQFRSGETWGVEIKRGLSPKLSLGFYNAVEDLQPVRSFVVYGGDDRFSVSQGGGH